MKAKCLNCSHENTFEEKDTYKDGMGNFILCEECNSSTDVNYVECPYCEGEGRVEDMADDVLGNSMAFTTDCECCESEGFVPIEEYKLAKEVYPKPSRVIMEQIRKGV